MKIGVIGAGRLGICFALLLDRGGYQVMASDIRSNYIAGLQRREIVTNEPGVAAMLADSSVNFTTDTRRVIQESDVIYVMVATPSRADGSYDISAVERVVADVAECDFDTTGKILVVGCTTNPGDCQHIQDRLRGQGIHLLYNPEFIAQGSILRDLQHADMVLIGGEQTDVIDRYKAVYHKIQPTVAPNIRTMSLTAAELVKIGINCFLTTKISYANMLGEVLIRSGLHNDVDAALAAVGSDSRIGPKYMRYGYGYGGPCLPRDNRAYAHYAKSVGLDFPLGTIVDEFNRQHTQFMINDLIQKNYNDLPYYMPSLTYKPNTDIVEESQQLAVCRGLLEYGKTVYVRYSELLPPAVQQELEDRYGNQVRFVRSDDPVLRDENLYGVLL